MDLYPAIDLRGGRCVRLYQGDYDRETDYGDDPVGRARAFAEAGAPWIHVVDLDAARSGEAGNRDVIAAICAAVDVPVQSGGGVRTVEAADALATALGQDNPRGYAAIGLACFGDPGLLALKEVAPVPVLGMAEAAFGLAAQRGGRIGVITGGERWVSMLHEHARLLGFSERIAGIRATPLTGAQIAADPDAACAPLAALVEACVAVDAADVVILGGAGLVGMAPRLQPLCPVPLLCSLDGLVAALLAVGRQAPARPRAGSFAKPPPTASIGLDPALAALLG